MNATKNSTSRVLAALVVAVASGSLYAQAPGGFQMPDPKQISGIPRPVDDLPAGSVSVRLIRGDMSNNIANHPVELHVGSKVETVKTDEAGRAQFDKLPAGATVKAVAVVDDERLESQEFPAPAQGGVRLMLVATDKTKGPATEPNAPPVSGQVALGGESRIVLEPGDETVAVYFLLDIINSARAPVNPTTLFMFDMPTGAVGTSILEGSSPLAAVNGTRVRVQGPFPPGKTTVQVACEVAAITGSLDIVQKFPATIEQLSVIVRKLGATKLSSPLIAQQQDMPAGNGETVITASGGSVAAGQPIALSLSDMPHHSPTPRWITLTLAIAIAAIGLWSARRPREDAAAREAERRRLINRREKLFNDLVRLENDRRSGRGDRARYATRREELLAALEHIYGSLDDPDDHAGLAA